MSNNITPKKSNAVSLPMNKLPSWISEMLPKAITAGCSKSTFVLEAYNYAAHNGIPDTPAKLKVAEKAIFAASQGGTNRQTNFADDKKNNEWDTVEASFINYYKNLTPVEQSIAKARFRKNNPGLQLANHVAYKSRKSA